MQLTDSKATKCEWPVRERETSFDERRLDRVTEKEETMTMAVVAHQSGNRKK
jgi:hypothetical protein